MKSKELKTHKNLIINTISMCYMVAVFVSSVYPTVWNNHERSFIAKIDPTIQNLLHVPVYAIVSILSMQTANLVFSGFRKKIIAVFLYGTLFGVINEIFQMFVPGRFATIGDILLNEIGICIGIIMLYMFSRSRNST